MIDSKYQGRGYGHRSLALVLKRVRRNPKAKALTLSVVKTEGGAANLYLKCGFKFTGKIEDGEHVMRLDL